MPILVVMVATSLFLLILSFHHHLVEPSSIIQSVLADESNGWFIPLYTIQPPTYLNSWAVLLAKGEGEKTAESIAQQYGFINHGKVQ